ncbi:hypothetical protein AXK58_24250 [Tsukamurella tyrosinosolvens]|uniref:Uncharacterized protein n=1 Tax=Tsukamurella tyrosinosolvens TaxID=57704 RepID=A0A1H4UPD5_TSUTY|nr:hypothetical protein [Tsukamurella tyrosinosolvens]KXO99069.1 hypothetical protein AXK58_24250 [Tsukamurella tyrosinosolvens]SEC69984.1 hypothetical protein SAMN04489793_2954 [Tsukamurella tyrosinosolvens]
MALEVSVTKVNFTVPADKTQAAYLAVLAADGETPEDWGYDTLIDFLCHHGELTPTEYDDGKVAFLDCPWDLDDEDSLVSLLDRLAPFATEDSMIEFTARHEGSWRYIVKNGELIRQDSKEVFE